jgi:hypothetical protein
MDHNIIHFEIMRFDAFPTPPKNLTMNSYQNVFMVFFALIESKNYYVIGEGRESKKKFGFINT